MLAAVERRCRCDDLTVAAAQFAEFSYGLNWHIEAEEQVLFPRFEALAGLSVGPTVVMRAEHVEIRRHMAALRAALAAPDCAAALQALADLAGVLSAHNVKEEMILYPTTDRLLTTRDRDDLGRAVQGT